MQEQKKPWFSFMATDKWVVFMNIMRILTFVTIVFLIVYIIKEVEYIKILGGACEYCMEKTGAICSLPPNLG